MGSGIKRALDEWPDISFTDDRERCMFIDTVHRKELGDARSAEESSQKIIELMQNDPAITIANLALRVGITERAIKKQIGKMKAQDRTSASARIKAAAGRWQIEPNRCLLRSFA